MPEGIEELTGAAKRVRPDAVVWKRDPALPHAQQGLKVLGVLIGQPEDVRDFLEKKSREQETCLSKRSTIPKKNSRERICRGCVRPKKTEAFADRHDANVESCLRQILGKGEIPAASQVSSSLALIERTGVHVHTVPGSRLTRPVGLCPDGKERHPPHRRNDDSPFPGRTSAIVSFRKSLCATRGGSGVQQESWTRGSSETKCGPDWTTHRELCCNLNKGLLHTHPSRHCPTSRVTRTDAQPFRFFLSRRLHFCCFVSTHCRCGRPPSCSVR